MTGKARMKTNYPGVFFRIAERKGKSGEERVYYIVFGSSGFSVGNPCQELAG